MRGLKEELSIKENPELRHALAHLYYAIEALSKGHPGEALYELKSIEGLIFWDTSERMTAHARKLYREETKKLQRQEKLQGQVARRGRNRKSGSRP